MTVRQLILAAIVTRFEALDWVGKVIDAAQVDGPEADISAPLQEGKAVIEISPLSDVSLRQDGIDAGWPVDAFRFDIVCVIYIPPQLTEGRRPSDVGAELHGELVKAETDGDNQTWGGLAIKTDVLGGGGVGFFDESSRILTAEHAATITYRHTRGNPEEVR